MDKELLIVAANVVMALCLILPLITPSWKWVLAYVPLFFVCYNVVEAYHWNDALQEMNQPGYQGSPGDALGLAGIVFAKIVSYFIFLSVVAIRLAMQPWWTNRKIRRDKKEKDRGASDTGRDG